MTERKWRTLVRIVETNPLKDELIVVLPGWNPEQRIKLKLSEAPVSVSEREPIFRCHAMVNTGAELAEDLIFEDWEPE